jgi:DNA-binding IclR family transcriptional regulator
MDNCDSETEDDSSVSSEDLRRLRPLYVLEMLSRSSMPLSLAQLTASMKVPKSTLMHLLHAMEARGYVLQMPGEKGYVPGSRSVDLSLRTLRGCNIRRDCRAVLRRLVSKVGETCNLTVLDGTRVLYIERVETTQPLRMHLQPGTWVPMHCTASGKLFLASMSLLERKNFLDHIQLQRMSSRTIVDMQALERDLLKIAKQDYGVDNEEFVSGMVAIAVPVRDPHGVVVATIACHAPTARVSLHEMLEKIPDLRRAAANAQAVLFPAAS